MKKLIVGILISILSIVCVGCGAKEEESIVESQVEDEQKTPVEEKKEEEKEVINVGVTLESVKSAPETDTAAFEYESIEGGIRITAYNGSDEIVVIPEEIEGEKVLSIGESSFANCETIKGLKLADSIIELGDSSFCNCFGLEVVVCGSGLLTIKEFAFSYCTSLYLIELNSQLENLEKACFAPTDALKEIYIPANVTTLNKPFVASQTNVTIIAEAGSAAEAYANTEGIPCEIK